MDIHAEFSGKKEGARIQFGHNGQSQEEKEEWKGHCHGRKEEKGKGNGHSTEEKKRGIDRII